MNLSHVSGSSTVPFVASTQQGLEKFNGLTTKYFHGASNHRDIES